MTATGLILGTPEYMAPEQVAGKRVDERSDVYALGIILFEMFTGRVPFSGDSAIAVGFRQLKEDPPAPSSINPQLPPALDVAILKALHKDPLHRYRTVADFRGALETALLPQGTAATPTESRDQSAQRIRT